MNQYDIPDRPIPSWVDNYDYKPHICPECGCEINETIYIKDVMVFGCVNFVKMFYASDADAVRFFDVEPYRY